MPNCYGCLLSNNQVTVYVKLALQFLCEVHTAIHSVRDTVISFDTLTQALYPFPYI